MFNDLNLPNINTDSLEGKLLSLIPYSTSAGDAKNLLGDPAEQIKRDDGTDIFTYKSSDQSRPHIVYLKDGQVTFVQVVFDSNYKLTADEVVKLFGEPGEKAYSTHSLNSQVYAYPGKGFLFHIDNKSNVFIVQKFKLMSITEYKNTIGKDFSAEPYGDTFATNKPASTELPVQNSVTPPDSSVPKTFIFSALLFIILAALLILFIFKKKYSKSQKI